MVLGKTVQQDSGHHAAKYVNDHHYYAGNQGRDEEIAPSVKIGRAENEIVDHDSYGRDDKNAN